MNFYQINCFLSVCNHMSFTKAAIELNITQQGISKIMNRMEEELQVPLFYRKNSKLELSDYGQLFLKSSISLANEYKGVLDQIADMRAERKVTLTMCIPAGMMHVFPFDIISDFNADYPDINVNVLQLSDLDCEKALINGDADVGFCTLPVNTAVFTVHRSHSEPVFFMISEKNPLSLCKTIDVSQLKREKFITIGADNKCGNGFIERCREAGFSPQVFMRTSDTQLITELCQKNAGISFYIGDNQHDLPGIKLVPEVNGNSWEVGLVTSAFKKSSPCLKV